VRMSPPSFSTASIDWPRYRWSTRSASARSYWKFCSSTRASPRRTFRWTVVGSIIAGTSASSITPPAGTSSVRRSLTSARSLLYTVSRNCRSWACASPLTITGSPASAKREEAAGATASLSSARRTRPQRTASGPTRSAGGKARPHGEGPAEGRVRAKGNRRAGPSAEDAERSRPGAAGAGHTLVRLMSGSPFGSGYARGAGFIPSGERAPPRPVARDLFRIARAGRAGTPVVRAAASVRRPVRGWGGSALRPPSLRSPGRGCRGSPRSPPSSGSSRPGSG